MAYQMRRKMIEALENVKFVPFSETNIESNLNQIVDELLSNGAIMPPCDFLQKCYVLPTIENGLADITEMKCLGFMLAHDSYVANLVTAKNKLYQPEFGKFGKTVFCTKEEAEQALKGGGE